MSAPADPAAPIVFLNPWERLIGPNRYLVEMLRRRPELAARSLVAFDADADADADSDGNDGAAGEYRELGCRTAVWPEIALLHPSLAPRRLLALASTHTLGLLRLRRRLRRLAPRPAMLVSNSEILWLGGMAARLLGVPHLQVFHAMTVFDRLERRPPLLRAYLRFLALGGRRFLAVSGAQAAALERGGVPAERISVLPNPIPVADLARRAAEPAPELRAAAGRSPVIVCAGRVCPIKGQDLLVEALAEVRRHHPKVLCLFAGRRGSSADVGDVEAFHRRLHRRIDELGLAGHLRFLGEVAELPALLALADLYVQPSRTESFGRVVAEAQVCGTPVVAFAVGGIPEVAGPGALLARPEDPADLARAILERLADPEAARRAAELGRAHVEAAYDAATVAERFERTLLDALETPEKAPCSPT